MRKLFGEDSTAFRVDPPAAPLVAPAREFPASRAGGLPDGRGDAGLGGRGGAAADLGRGRDVLAPGSPGIAPAAEAWQALPLGPGWYPYLQALQDPSYRKDQLGLVRVRGLMTKPSGPPPVGGEVLATLPAAYRPGKKELFAVADGGGTHVRVDVLPDGQILWVASTATAQTVSLSGIAFATD